MSDGGKRFPSAEGTQTAKRRLAAAVESIGCLREIGGGGLVEVADEFYVEGIGAVDVAEEDDGEVAFDVVFDLDELLLVGGGV